MRFAPPPGERRGLEIHIHPYSGALLPAVRGGAFFQFVDSTHRWLLRTSPGPSALRAPTVAWLEEFTHIGFHAQLGRHPGQDDPIDPLLSQLQHQVIRLRSIQLVGRGDDGLAVFDEGAGQDAGKHIL